MDLLNRLPESLPKPSFPHWFLSTHLIVEELPSQHSLELQRFKSKHSQAPLSSLLVSSRLLSSLLLSSLLVSSPLVSSPLVSSPLISSPLVSSRMVSSRLISSRLVSSRLIFSPPVTSLELVTSIKLVSFEPPNYLSFWSTYFTRSFKVIRVLAMNSYSLQLISFIPTFDSYFLTSLSCLGFSEPFMWSVSLCLLRFFVLLIETFLMAFGWIVLQ